MPSGPGIFPSFNIFSALLISGFEGGFVLTLKIKKFAVSVGGSLLRVSLKCSSHLHLCSTSFFMVLPSLSYTGFERFLLSLLVFLLHHRIPSCLFCALPFQLVLLGHWCSFVCLFLTALFSCQYVAWCSCFSSTVSQRLTICFLSLISIHVPHLMFSLSCLELLSRFHVVWPIQCLWSPLSNPLRLQTCFSQHS